MTSRWNTNSKESGLKVFSTKQKAEKAYNILDKLIFKGANLNALDSFGNSALWRFCLQANQILPTYDRTNNCERTDRIFTKELHEDLLKILKLLKKSGADFSYVSPTCNATVLDFYKAGSLHELLVEVNK